MLYAGIALSADPDGHQLCALEETQGREGVELHATFYEPAPVAQIAREVARLDQLIVALDAPPEDGDRACDAILRERGLVADDPNRPPDQARLGAVGDVLEALATLQLYEPRGGGDVQGAVGSEAWHAARLIETRADAVFTALQGYRPPARGNPMGNHARIQALTLQRVVDPEDGLWHRTGDELDAACAGYVAFAYAVGGATWVGRPEEGVVVLPLQPLESYEPEPAPARAPFPA